MIEEKENELEKLLKDSVKAYGINLGQKQLEKFFLYKDLLLEWNSKMNLTAIEEDRDVIIKHFSDSLSIAPHLPGGQSRFIDIGTGAGFPGIPVKIAFPELNVTLVDALEKRVRFLEEVIKRLGLSGIRAFHGRAEELGKTAEHREKYDIAVARAVASLPVLLEYCMPFIKVGGMFIAMKGSDIGELEQAKKALEVLGGEIARVDELTLPFSDIKRNIIVIKKLRQTPPKYPRKPGKPSREPLI